MTLPKERGVTPELSTLTSKELKSDGLEKVRFNMKRSIYSSTQNERSDSDVIVDRLLNSHCIKPSCLCMTKTVSKDLGSSLSVNVMDKLNQFRVIANCNSDNLSVIKVVSVYPCRGTALSTVSNIPPEERHITKLFKDQLCVSQTRHAVFLNTALIY